MSRPFTASLRFITAVMLALGVSACDPPDPNDETPDAPEATEGSASAEQTDGKVSDEDLDNAAGGRYI